MIFNYAYRSRIFFKVVLMLAIAVPSFAGVSRQIQEQYKKDYENKALYLKIPVYSEKQFITISGKSFRIEPGSGPAKFKVGDQLRVLAFDFAGDEIKLKMGGIAVISTVEVIYKFDTGLQESFPNKDVFDRALRATLTEGLKYTEIDEAKRTVIEDRFDRSVREIAESASMSRDSVLKSIASLLPAYQDAQRDIESLKNKVQDLSGQLSQSQSESRKLGSESKTQQAELKGQQAELARLKGDYAASQEKANNYASQVSRLSDELRDVKGNAQGGQKQILELSQVKAKLQKEADSLGQQVAALRTNLENQKAANARMASDNDELKAANQKEKEKIEKLQGMIDVISLKGDALTKQYVNLQEFRQSIDLLRTRIVEEAADGGIYSGKANVYLGTTLLGSLAWSIPIRLNHGENQSAEATFSAESINNVQMTPEEKRIRNSLGGDRLKIRLDMASSSETMSVSAEKLKPLREIGERDRSTWKWTISNQGTQDSRLLLTARLINRNSNEIPLFQQERVLAASNAVRQARNYLQPIPLAIGAVIGFLLFGIAGIFRRHKSPGNRSSSPAESSQPHSSTGPKQL